MWSAGVGYVGVVSWGGVCGCGQLGWGMWVWSAGVGYVGVVSRGGGIWVWSVGVGYVGVVSRGGGYMCVVSWGGVCGCGQQGADIASPPSPINT